VNRDADLIQLLEAAGRTVEPSADIDLAPAILARIETTPRRTGPSRPVRLAIAVGVALLLVAAAIAADLVPGLRLVPADRHPSDATPLGQASDLGEPASLAEAAAAAGLERVHVPDIAQLASPDVFVDGRLVHLVLPSSPDLPGLGDSDIGLILTQWAAGSDDVLVKAVPDDGVESVAVGDSAGWWITGPHEVAPFRDEATRGWRRTDHVLVWHRDGVSFRLESRLRLEQAIDIATSVMR
jgi:hypothetical protein